MSAANTWDRYGSPTPATPVRHSPQLAQLGNQIAAWFRYAYGQSDAAIASTLSQVGYTATQPVIARDRLEAFDGFLESSTSEGSVTLSARLPEFPGPVAPPAPSDPVRSMSEHSLRTTDIRMPPLHTDEGIRLAEFCRVHLPATGVILLSQYVEIGYIRTLLQSGTQRRGYLLKERVADLDDLLSAIGDVAAGRSAIDPKVVEALVRVRTDAGDRKLAALSPRELDVLSAIAQGHTNTAIADTLVLTRHAVEKHINSIFQTRPFRGSRHPSSGSGGPDVPRRRPR